MFSVCPTALERVAGLVLFPGYTAQARAKLYADLAGYRVGTAARGKALDKARSLGWSEAEARTLEAWLPPSYLLYGTANTMDSHLRGKLTRKSEKKLARDSSLSSDQAKKLQANSEYQN